MRKMFIDDYIEHYTIVRGFLYHQVLHLFSPK